MVTQFPSYYRDKLNQILNESSIPIPKKEDLNLARFIRMARQLNVPSYIANIQFDDMGLYDNIERRYYMDIPSQTVPFLFGMLSSISVSPDHIEVSNEYQATIYMPKNQSSAQKDAYIEKICSNWGLNQLRTHMSHLVGYDTGPWKFVEIQDETEINFHNAGFSNIVSQHLKPFAPLFFNQPDDIQKWQNSFKA